MDFLSTSASVIEFGCISPSPTESIPDFQWLLDLRGVKELLHFRVDSQFPLQLTLPLHMDVEAKLAEGLDSVQCLLISIFNCDSAAGQAL